MQLTAEINKGNKSVRTLVIAILGIITIVSFSYYLDREDLKSESQLTAEREFKLEPTTTSEEVKSSYKNGNYKSIGAYISPGGAEEIEVELKVENSIVVEAEVKSLATRPESVKFQTLFIENYQQAVIGQDIDTLNLDKIAGSSLTPKGFNDALEKIRNQAKG